jgi:hypothetical protein
MRRLLVLLAGVGLTSATGCYHTGGKCDCAPPVQPCCIYGLYPPAFGMPVLPPAPPGPAAAPPPAPATTTQAAAEVPADSAPSMPVKENVGLPREP